jgi:hypothetical protein
MPVTLDHLSKWSEAPAPGLPFLRPLVCKGDPARISVFLVGINPATPIYPSEKLKCDAYAAALVDDELFRKMYRNARQTDEGRTRQGINSFIQWLGVRTDHVVAETNVIPFPTRNLEELYGPEMNLVRIRAKDVFLQLLNAAEPKTIIVHGSHAKNEIVDLMFSKGMVTDQSWKTIPNKDIESGKARLGVKYASGNRATMIGCRTFMYYGKSGDSFRQFREHVLECLGNVT